MKQKKTEGTSGGRPNTVNVVQEERIEQEGSKRETQADRANADDNSDDDFLMCSSDEEEEERISRPDVATSKGIGPISVDFDDLYDCEAKTTTSTTAKLHGTPKPSTSKLPQPRIFIPRTSDIELFHAVLTNDTERLATLLMRLSPTETLAIRDPSRRTLYHYAALSSRPVQDIVFNHVTAFNDRRMAAQVGNIKKEKGVLDTWLAKSEMGESGWVPSSVKSAQEACLKQKQHDWHAICRSLDLDQRSILHYMATVPGDMRLADDPIFLHVVRTNKDIRCSQDVLQKAPLHVAVEHGNIMQIKWYFRMGVNIDRDGAKHLLSCCRQKSVRDAVVKEFKRIDENAYRIRQAGPKGDTDDREWDVGLSVLAGATLEVVQDRALDEFQHSALAAAIRYGNVEVVSTLLERGADAKACDSNGWTALHVCADEGTATHVEIAKILLSPPFSVPVMAKSLKGRTPLHLAAKSSRSEAWRARHDEGEDIIKTLCDSEADVDEADCHGNTALMLACRSNNISAALILLQIGCDAAAVQKNGWNCLHLAALRGHVEIVRLLISWEEGVGYLSDATDHYGRKPSDVAQNQRTRRLLANKWSACYHGNVNGVKLLLRGIEAARRNEFVCDQTVRTGRTSLHLAVQGYFDHLEALKDTKRQSKAQEQANNSATPQRRYLQVVSLLLEAGAGPFTPDKWGITPLMIASTIDDELLMNALIENRTDSKQLLGVDEDGNTALHYGYAFCRAQISSILEDELEDEEEIANQAGKLPLDMTGYRHRVFPKAFQKHQRKLQRRGLGLLPWKDSGFGQRK